MLILSPARLLPTARGAEEFPLPLPPHFLWEEQEPSGQLGFCGLFPRWAGRGRPAGLPCRISLEGCAFVSLAQHLCQRRKCTTGLPFTSVRLLAPGGRSAFHLRIQAPSPPRLDPAPGHSPGLRVTCPQVRWRAAESCGICQHLAPLLLAACESVLPLKEKSHPPFKSLIERPLLSH